MMMVSLYSTSVASAIFPFLWRALRRRRSSSAGVGRLLRYTWTPQPASPAATALPMTTQVISPDERKFASGGFIFSNGLARDRSLLEDLVVILQELFQALIRERVIEEHIQNFERHRSNLRSRHRCLDHVCGRPQRSRQNLRLEAVILVDGRESANQIHPGPADVINPADERTDDVGPGFGRKQCLTRGETQRHIDAQAFFAERGGCLDAFPSKRALHNDILMNAGKLASLADHVL